ncbi:MAG: hypothetical protein DMG65_04180 [Candidatus Angelobacter sp. Gp1-AA117]|nr:MAG: hypothetical protein DMG65_04180 [Candidatus Angelobacter sp. Gp1-AA117]
MPRHQSTLVVALALFVCLSVPAFADCTHPANAIEAENCLPGTPQGQWDVDVVGDPTIQGFATDISVNVGQTIFFKINTDATAYRLDIYRMGYYQGNGARLVATVNPSAHLPQTQPACLTDAATKLMDCGNWAVSASWAVPADAVSGIYFAHLIRLDNGGDSHIAFIVRNDASHSDVLFQTSDETWQAYNDYGGNSLYGAAAEFDLANRSFKVSYNRPSDTRRFEAASWVFYAEYPMVRWLEANAYDVTYFTSVDAARTGTLIKNHKLFLSVGHDEYWSGPKRASIEAARDAGVNLAFLSGNEAFWKTRWENSIDGSNTPYRTLVCYKETLVNAVIDPAFPVWTGTWADPRFSPPGDGGRPQNALTGTFFKVNGPGADTLNQSIQVPAADGKMRFWRNTPVATQLPGHTWILPPGTLGYEWDVDTDNGFRPAGLFHLSTSTYTLTSDFLLDFGANFGAGTATHNLTLYRAPSGALVFGSGTVQWPFGLDDNHDNPLGTTINGTFPDVNMQQATVNLFADMGVQPQALQPGLVAATKSADTVAPVTSINPVSGGLQAGTTSTISGTAADSGGVVAGVEFSDDGGTTWHPATGRESWTFTVKPPRLGPLTLMTRAVDDSGNLSAPVSTSFMVTGHDCPCNIWNASTTPGLIDAGDGGSGEYGVRFTADYDGLITGIRFYKATTNIGTHSGHLWSNTGTLLASATFTGESASGWQQVNFSTPVPVTANTTYVASYFAPNGHYSADNHYFSAGSDNPPLHAPQDGISGANGVYVYGSHPGFPNQTFASTNYWADVVYMPTSGIPGIPASLVLAQNSLSFSAFIGQPNPPSQTINFYNQSTDTLNWTASTNGSWLTVSPGSGSVPGSFSASVNIAGLAGGTYQGTITITAAGAANSPVTIPVTLTVSSLLLSDDFSSGTLEGWLFSPLGMASHWSVVNGALQNSGSGHTQIYTGDSSWTNYSFQADVKLSTMNDWPGGIRGRVNPATGAAYAAWMYPAEGIIRLYRTIAWDIGAGFTEIGEGAANFDNTAFHQLKLSFQGSQIQVLYDGNVVVTATDANYPSGMIALDVSTEAITYDSIKVTTNSPSGNSLLSGASSLNFSGTFQGANPAAQSVQLSASGTGALAWTAVSTVPWLSVSPSGGPTPATLQVSVNTAGLAGGSYTGAIRLVSLGATNTSQLINVNLNVVVPPPVIILSPAQLSFVAVTGQPNPAAQAFSVTNGGFGTLSWSATSSASWLKLSAVSGSTPSSINVSVDPTGLAPGAYVGSVTVASVGVGNSPQSIAVSLSVLVPEMSENFSGLAKGWVISPMGLASGWSVSNGVYSFSGIGFSQSCAGDTNWSDYIFDTNIKLSNLSNWPGGVRGRVNPVTGAGYAVWLYPGSGFAILYRVPQWDINGPGLTVLAQANLSFDTTASHDLKMQFQGSNITISWDGQLLMNATDPAYSSGLVCMDADNQPISYSNVSVAASDPAINLSAAPSSLMFSALPGSPASQQIISVDAQNAVTTWAVSTDQPWLTAVASANFTAPRGQAPATATVSVNTAGLAEGTYFGNIKLYAPGTANSPLLVPVTLAIKTAALSVNPSSVTLFGASGFNPSRNIAVTNAGTGSLSWSASVDTAWASLSAASGTAPAAPILSADTTGLAAGSYSGNLTVNSVDVANGPITVPLTLNVGNLLFNDNFNSGSAGNWTISPLGNAAGWSVVNGSYTYNGGGHTQSWAGDPTWTDYTVGVDFKLASVNDFPGGIRGRVNTTTGASYGVWIYPAEGVLKLFRIGQWSIDADTTLLAQSPVVSMNTSFHNITLGFKGAEIQVYYDNVQVLQVTDTSYAQGAVALDTSNQPIAFDNVVVISR